MNLYNRNLIYSLSKCGVVNTRWNYPILPIIFIEAANCCNTMQQGKLNPIISIMNSSYSIRYISYLVHDISE